MIIGVHWEHEAVHINSIANRIFIHHKEWEGYLVGKLVFIIKQITANSNISSHPMCL